MANAPITRTIRIYPTVSGSTALLEYRGSGSDVVAFDVEVIPATVQRLRDMKLAAIAGMSLSGLADTFFTDGITGFRLMPTVVRFANVNGIAHVIAPTAGLVRGDVVRVSGILVG